MEWGRQRGYRRGKNREYKCYKNRTHVWNSLKMKSKFIYSWILYFVHVCLLNYASCRSFVFFFPITFPMNSKYHSRLIYLHTWFCFSFLRSHCFPYQDASSPSMWCPWRQLPDTGRAWNTAKLHAHRSQTQWCWDHQTDREIKAERGYATPQRKAGELSLCRVEILQTLVFTVVWISENPHSLALNSVWEGIEFSVTLS